MPVIGDIVRCVCNYSAPNSSAIQNVFWWEIADGSISNANLLAAVDTWVTSTYGAEWASMAVSDFTLDSVDVDLINDNGTVLSNVGAAPIGLVGERISDMTTGVVSAYIKADTLLPKQRGSKYLPGLGDADIADSLIQSGVLAAMAQILVEWLLSVATPTSATLTPGILSRPLGAFVPFIAAGSLTDVPAYQRRRKPNVGA